MDLKEEVKRAGGIMSLADVARDAGVTHSAVRKWRKQDDWPEPLDSIGEGTEQPVELFLAADVRQWQGARA